MGNESDSIIYIIWYVATPVTVQLIIIINNFVNDVHKIFVDQNSKLIDILNGYFQIFWHYCSIDIILWEDKKDTVGENTELQLDVKVLEKLLKLGIQKIKIKSIKKYNIFND